MRVEKRFEHLSKDNDLLPYHNLIITLFATENVLERDVHSIRALICGVGYDFSEKLTFPPISDILFFC